MSLELVQALHDALSRTALERDGKDVDGNASVLVQFAAGDYSSVKKVLEQAKKDLDWKDKHAIADAAGVPSHSETGGPLPVDTRVDLAAATLPADDTAPPGSPAPEPVAMEPAAGSPPREELPPA